VIDLNALIFMKKQFVAKKMANRFSYSPFCIKKAATFVAA